VSQLWLFEHYPLGHKGLLFDPNVSFRLSNSYIETGGNDMGQNYRRCSLGAEASLVKGAGNDVRRYGGVLRPFTRLATQERPSLSFNCRR
jgi:hypothetical protein